jgi:hypothetical protein
VEDIFGFVLFHCCFPVAEGVECDLVESWVLEFAGCPLRCPTNELRYPRSS